MRIRLTLLLCLWCAPSVASAAGVIEQTVGNHAAAGTVAVTLNSVKAGSALIALAFSFNDSDYTVASDVAGAFTRDTVYYKPASYVSTIWSKLNVTAGTHVVTLAAGTTNSTIQVWEVSGMATSSAFDQVATSTPSGLSPALTATSTTAQADEFVVGFIHGTDAGDVIVLTPGSGYTGYQINDASFHRYFSGEAKIVSATGTYGPNWTSNTSIAFEGIVATYKLAASASDALKGKLGSMGVGR